MTESNTKYPWDEIKAKYETGNYDMGELAKIYGFNQNYGYRKSKNEGWEKGKTADKVGQKAVEQVIDEEADKEAELKEEYARILKAVRRATTQEVRDIVSDDGGKGDRDIIVNLEKITRIIKRIRTEDWEVHEIKEMADRVEEAIEGEVSIKKLHELANGFEVEDDAPSRN